MPAPTLVDLSPEDGARRYDAMAPEQQDAVLSLTKAGRSPSEAVQIVEAQGAAYSAQQPSTLDSIGAALAQGGSRLAGGLDDEAGGILESMGHGGRIASAAMPWAAPLIAAGSAAVNRGAYEGARDAQESGRLALVEKAPMGAAAGEGAALVAGLASGGARGVGGASSLPQLVKKSAAAGMKAGGAAGAVQGFGESRGALPSLGGAAVGGAAGAALGGTLGAAGAALPSLVRKAGASGGQVMDKARLEIARSSPKSQAEALSALPVVGDKLAKARLALERKSPAPQDDYAAMLREQMNDPVPVAAPRPSASPVPEVTKATAPVAGPAGAVKPAVEPPPIDYTREAQAFDPDAAAWNSWAKGVTPTPAPRPDLDAAAQVLSTSTRSMRTPTTPGPLPALQPKPAAPPMPDMPADVMAGGPPALQRKPAAPPAPALQPKAPAPMSPEEVAAFQQAEFARSGVPPPSQLPPAPPIATKRIGPVDAPPQQMSPRPAKPALQPKFKALPPEQQKQAVEQLAKSGVSLVDAAKKLGVPQKQIAAWFKAAQIGANP